MKREEFESIVLADPHLAEPIRESAQSVRAKQFSVLTEAAVIALMFPIARFLLTHVGLPWLSELGRYSELQRRRVHEWIDSKYRDEGFDPEEAESASDALIERLEATTDTSARSAWERLVQLFTAAKGA